MPTPWTKCNCKEWGKVVMRGKASTFGTPADFCRQFPVDQQVEGKTNNKKFQLII